MQIPSLVSIIIPTHNRLELLKQTINSVMGQTWNNWELIIVDDGSTDGTIDYLNSLNEPRLRLLLLPHCGNVARVRNAGVRVASGEYIAFLDSDDLWASDKLAIQLPRMQETGARWSYTFYDHIDEAGHTILTKSGQPKLLSGFITREILATEVGVSICSVVVEKELLIEVGIFDEDPLNKREDYDLSLRLSLAAPVLAIPDTLMHLRVHAGRTTSQCTDSYERMAYVYGKFCRITNDISLQRLARARKAKHLAEAAAINLVRKNGRAAFRNLIAAIQSGAGIRILLSALKHGLHFGEGGTLHLYSSKS